MITPTPQAEWSGLALAERNYETVPALRGEAMWETKLDQGDYFQFYYYHLHHLRRETQLLDQ